jgi:hypothetical protein
MEQYDREELYERVWEKPMLKVAEEYGVSSVALGKTCRKLCVPVPGRGHWAKVAHGHQGVRKIPLPKLDKVPVICRSPIAAKKPPSFDQADPEFAAVDQLFSSGALNSQPVGPTARTHPLIRHSTSLLRSRSRKDEHGILLPRDVGGLDVKVSEGTLERALQVMAQVVAVLERQGYSVTVSDTSRTAAVINNERVFFGIEEPIRKVVVQKPRVPNPTDRWDYDETISYEPGGKLALCIHSGTSSGERGERVRWSDAKVQRVESRVADFVAGLMRIAIVQRRREEKRKRDEAEKEKRARERAQLQKEVQEEEEQLKKFDDWMEAWERAERMRKFITAYAEKSSSWSAEKQPKYKAWIEWATQQADRVDPFVSEKPASVLDRKHEISRW